MISALVVLWPENTQEIGRIHFVLLWWGKDGGIMKIKSVGLLTATNRM